MEEAENAPPLLKKITVSVCVYVCLWSSWATETEEEKSRRTDVNTHIHTHSHSNTFTQAEDFTLRPKF